MFTLILVTLLAGSCIPANSHNLEEDWIDSDVIADRDDVSDESDQFQNQPYYPRDDKNVGRKVAQKSFYSTPKSVKNIKTLDIMKPIYLTENVRYPYFAEPINNIVLKPRKSNAINENFRENEPASKTSRSSENQNKVFFSKCDSDKPSPICNFMSKIIRLPLANFDQVKLIPEEPQSQNQNLAKNKIIFNVGAKINEKIAPYFEEYIQSITNMFDSISNSQYDSFKKIPETQFSYPIRAKINKNSNIDLDPEQKDFSPKVRKSESMNTASKSKELLVQPPASNSGKANTIVNKNSEKSNESIFNKNDNFYNFMQSFSNVVFKTALEYVNKIKNINVIS